MLISHARKQKGRGPGARFHLDRVKRHLADGREVELISPGNTGVKGQTWPDYRVDGKLTGLKSIDATSSNGLSEGIRDASDQVKGYPDRKTGELGAADIEIRGDVRQAGDIDKTVREALGQRDGVDTVNIYGETGNMIGQWVRTANGEISGGLDSP